MDNNQVLRKSVKLLHALQDIKYKELAELLEIKQGSFTNWLNGYYDLCDKKQIRLDEIISTLKEY